MFQFLLHLIFDGVSNLKKKKRKICTYVLLTNVEKKIRKKERVEARESVADMLYATFRMQLGY